MQLTPQQGVPQGPSQAELIAHINQLTRLVNEQQRRQQTLLSRPEYFAGVPASEMLAGFFSRHENLAVEMLERSDGLWMISGSKGEVYWANEAFCKWIGYSIFEFTREENPIRWTDFTYQDDSLTADVELTHRAYSGDISKFHLKKFYIPKGGSRQFVEIFVRRYPPEGSLPCQFLVVEVRPISDGITDLVYAYEELLRSNRKEMETYRTNLEALRCIVESSVSKNSDAILRWSEVKKSISKYPTRWATGAIVLLSAAGQIKIPEIIERIISTNLFIP